MSKNEKKARTFNFEELLGKTIKTAQERDLRTRTGRSIDRKFTKILRRGKIIYFMGEMTLTDRPAERWVDP